jgi:transposase-like protein
LKAGVGEVGLPWVWLTITARLRLRWKDRHRAHPYPKEFRRDVIAVARQGDQSIAQVARRFGISESCLNRWLRIADRDEGLSAARPGRLLMIGEA